MSAAAINDRRMRAIEAGQDVSSVTGDDVPRAIETAVEVATQLKITADIIAAFTDDPDEQISAEGALAAAFRAAGFEVVE